MFAQNFLRWFRHQVLWNTLLAEASLKELVRIGTQTRAVIQRTDHGVTLTSVSDGSGSGLSIHLSRSLSYQLMLPGLDSLLEAPP